ncbi:MAG: efflux RND transporter periplasmic adaptor subunit [Candidatus Thiodiazotropha lotti]|nr:efflux RND transporter periplasmic adaptor subunit [Candidatus Thiodiazotropha lotti]
MKTIRYWSAFLSILTLFGLSGCQQEDNEAVTESIRPIKTITLDAKANAVEERRFPALVRATNSSVLSFEVSGKVLEVKVNAGDQVTTGQLLAIIDNESYKLTVQSLEADLKKAEADFRNQDSDYKRKQGLSKKGYVSASDLDQAQASREAARNQVAMAKSQLDIAKRNLRNTELKAPFDGHISTRLVEPFQEVSSGQELFEIDALGELEVKLSLPENLIGRLKLGDTGEVTFPGLANTKILGIVSEIGTHAETANVFPVTLRLQELPESLFPGMTAEVQLLIGQGEQADGFLLPAPAIIAGAGQEPGRHFVFVFDPKTNTVTKTPVTVSGGQKQLARVSEGLKPGDIVAVAGASFLSDGMRVRLLEKLQR